MGKVSNFVLVSTLLMYLLPGCASYERGAQHKSHQDSTRTQSSIFMENKNISNIEPETVDELLEQLKDIQQQAELGMECDKYTPHINKIDEKINSNETSEVETLVHELAGKLINDGSDCSLSLLKNLKSFTYLRYEFYDEKYKVKMRPSLNPFKYLLVGSLVSASIITLPLVIANPDSAKDLVKSGLEDIKGGLTISQKKKIENSYYKVFEVNPYQKTEKVIYNNLPSNKK